MDGVTDGSERFAPAKSQVKMNVKKTRSRVQQTKYRGRVIEGLHESRFCPSKVGAQWREPTSEALSIGLCRNCNGDDTTIKKEQQCSNGAHFVR